MTDNRSTQRKQVGLLVKLAHKGVEDFAARYATNLSDGGMFIRTRTPKERGTEVNFKVEIADGQRVLQGTAVVRWTRGENHPEGPPGMGLEFLKLDPASRALVDRMVGKPAPAPARAAPGLGDALFGDAVPELAPAAVSPKPPTVAPAGTPGKGLPAAPSIPASTPSKGLAAAPSIAPASTPSKGLAAAPSIAPAIAPASTPSKGLAAAPAKPPGQGQPAALDLDQLFAGAATAGAPEAPAEDEPFVFGAPPPVVKTEKEIDLDLDALLASTPPPPEEDLFAAATAGYDLELEPVEPLPPLPSSPGTGVEPPAVTESGLFGGSSDSLALDVEVEVEPAPAPAPLPPGARPSAKPRPVEPEAPRAPVVLQAPAPPPAPKPAAVTGGPVYLKDIKPGDGTGPIIGIDLGTTNSACAVLSKGRPLILSSKDGYNTIPSVVALTQAGKLQVGHRAKGQMVLNPRQSIFGAKRLVGREFDSATVKQVKERSHFEIVAGSDRRAAVKLGPDTLSLEEVQGLVLKECKDMAEQALGGPVTRAVVTCPAYYSEPQREAVRRAGAMAGLKVERVLNEPTAAALAFGMNRELKKTVLVYDLGGGTFDATLLKLDQNVFEVLATGGDVFLGGVDFDNQLVDLLLERFATWHKRPFSGDQVALSRVTEVAEKMKVALSERSSFEVSLPMLEMDAAGKPLDLRTTVTRAEMEQACGELVDRTIQAVQDVLLDAKLKASQVDDIILVGGMSRMPLVREKLKAVFKKPPHASVNADEAVALGAALYSGTVDKVSSLVLIDVVPMTIGLGRPGGAFHRLIERNTALPVTRSFGISTQKHDETTLEVMVFQGEDNNVSGNEFLGAITISGLPKGPAGSVQVAVTLSLDAECVLNVEAREFRTRTVVRSTLATRYTSEEIAQRLGISREKQAATNKARTEELDKRAGGFWGKLKGLFKK